MLFSADEVAIAEGDGLKRFENGLVLAQRIVVGGESSGICQKWAVYTDRNMVILHHFFGNTKFASRCQV